MRVTEVRSLLVRIPLERPVRIATREVRGREFVLVFVKTEDGREGVGYTYAGTVGGTMVRAAVDDILSALVVGGDADLIEHHWAAMFQFERILVERLAPSRGRVRIPERAGLGLVLDRAAIERFALR